MTDPISKGGVPITPGQIDLLAAIIREVDGNHDKGAGALAEGILCHPAWKRLIPWITVHPMPIPVAERLPGPDDLSDDGHIYMSCWFLCQRVGEPEWHRISPLSLPKCHELGYTHWLPGHAIPLPTDD